MANSPTAKQLRKWNELVAQGCIACRIDGRGYVPATIHHCGPTCGKRDHDRVIGLCAEHHLYQFAVEGVPNREKNPIEFAARYGTDDELQKMSE